MKFHGKYLKNPNENFLKLIVCYYALRMRRRIGVQNVM